MSNLAEKKCVPCEGGMAPLTETEAVAFKENVRGWNLADDVKSIARRFVFKDFKEAMAFANKVADVAESEGHHPDFSISYNTLTLTLTTHAIGGLSENDFILAAKINALAA